MQFAPLVHQVRRLVEDWPNPFEHFATPMRLPPVRFACWREETTVNPPHSQNCSDDVCGVASPWLAHRRGSLRNDGSTAADGQTSIVSFPQTSTFGAVGEARTRPRVLTGHLAVRRSRLAIGGKMSADKSPELVGRNCFWPIRCHFPQFPSRLDLLVPQMSVFGSTGDSIVPKTVNATN